VLPHIVPMVKEGLVIIQDTEVISTAPTLLDMVTKFLSNDPHIASRFTKKFQEKSSQKSLLQDPAQAPRGPNRMTEAPIRQIAAPITSH
jgi:hypothetical protein